MPTNNLLIASDDAALFGQDAGNARADDLPLTVIERRPGWKFVDVAELWRCRELLFFLVWRDVKVRYKQTLLGAGWAVIEANAVWAAGLYGCEAAAVLPALARAAVPRAAVTTDSAWINAPGR